MRLLSATVRAYRLHRETTVVFDPRRTLIGGPNESGKSTFAEAVHRALFLKARGNTAEHRAMKSTLHAGAPEVELAFEAGGKVHQLRKRFGPAGDTTLSSAQGMTLTGEAAETELARLLGVGAGANGKVALGQWSHLWVWQGESAHDPTPHATHQKDGLLLRLQTLGGAAAMQSETDGRIAGQVAEAYGAIFNNKGTPRSHSALARAGAEAAGLAEAEAAARARAAALEESAAVFTKAGAEVSRFTREIADLTAQQDQAVRQDILIRRHQDQEAVQAHAEAAAAAKLRLLQQQAAQWDTLRRELTVLEAELTPLDAATADLAGREASARHAAAAASQAFENAVAATAASRRQHDFLQAGLRGHEAGAGLAALLQRAAQVEDYRAETEKLRIELAGLPSVQAPELALLQRLDAACHSADAALTAMAAGVELLAAGEPVLLAGEPLAVGETRILTGDAEIQLGGSYRLRIRPGGGTSLAAAREKSVETRRQSLAAFEKYGVRTLEEAAGISARRADLASKLLAGEAALKSLQAGVLPAALAEAREAVTAAAAETARRAPVGEGAGAEAGLPPGEIRVLLTEAVRALAGAEAAAESQKMLRDTAVRTAANHAAALQRHQESLLERQHRRTGLLAQLELLQAGEGDESARTAALEEAGRGQREAALALAQTRQILQELQPEQAVRTLERLRRSLELLSAQRAASETRRAVAAEQLKSDGLEDPASNLALTAARAADARETVRTLQRRAGACRLLHEVFTGEQAALADHFTRPLADCISGYLECIFGRGTRAAVALEDHAFTGLRLIRPQDSAGALEFDTLSGGTREQTAAAVRLAMAQVLAAGHEGTLPVIFDDAFAHSDESRLGQLQNMLDLAAARGLQIILLTHQPANYAALGAEAVMLERPTGGFGSGFKEITPFG